MIWLCTGCNQTYNASKSALCPRCHTSNGQQEQSSTGIVDTCTDVVGEVIGASFDVVGSAIGAIFDGL